MTRLVGKRVENLTESKAMELLDEVRAAEKIDQAFFEQGRLQRKKLGGQHHINRPGSGTSAGKKLAQIETKITVNLVHAHIRSLLPTVFFREPTVNATPLNFLQAGKEETWEQVLNAVIRRNGYKKETKATTLDALTYHEGWKKITQNLPEDADQDAEDGGGVGSTETSHTVRGPTPWGSKNIPVSIRISPQNVIVDSLAPGRDPDHARFIAIKYRRPLSEMRADSRYDIPADFDTSQTDKSVAGAAVRRMDETEDIGRGPGLAGPVFGDNVGVQMMTFYEIYVYQDVDRKLFRQCVWLAVGAKKPIREATWEEMFGTYFPGWPLHRIVFNPVPDDYPMAEVQVWQQLQEAINWTMGKLVSFVSQNNQRWVVNSNAVKDPKKLRQQILSGKAVEVIETKDGVRVQDVLASVQAAGVPNDTYRLIDILLTFVEKTSLLGQNAQQTGGVFRTATEAEKVSQATAIRDTERIDVMRDFLKADMEKLAALIRHTATQELVFKLAGDTGKVQWGRFEPEDLKWVPDIDIQVDSFREMQQQEEVTKWLQVFGIAVQIFPLIGPVVRLDVIFTELVKAAKVPNPELIIGNLVGQREFQMIEIMQMIRGLDVPVQPTDPHGEHIAAIELFMNSPVFAELKAEGDPAFDKILAHRGGHELELQQLRDLSGPGQPQSLGQNSTDLLGNDARSEAGLRREASRTGGRAQQEFT